MRRHGISPGAIPADAIILNRREPFFRVYYVESITVVSIAALAALAVAIVLLRKNVRKRVQLQTQGARLEEMVAEKELLFREMNHRIKNNLNILTSLVSLQMSATDDDTLRGHLQGVAGKLRTMSLIHTKLQKRGNDAGIDTGEYLTSLANQVFQTMRPSAAGIRLDLDLPSMEMDVKVAVPCGLIVNELLTNFLKYAFTGDGASGTVVVALSTPSAGTVLLSVRDDGVGLPPGFDLTRDAGLGLKVVESLCRQLNGTLTATAAGGTTVAIEFPVSRV
jgi:two-component sensor histidine kinase